jgi:hypothetical protein
MLHVGRPNIGNRESLLARVNDILDHRWLTNRGIYVREFDALRCATAQWRWRLPCAPWE